MERIIVYGVERPLATRLADYLNQQRFEVFSFTSESVDVRQMPEIIASMEQFKPHAVVNCAEFDDVERCEQMPERAIAWNSLGAANVALACRMKDVSLVHISSDMVFPGINGPKRDTEEPYPVNSYGVSKWLGEKAVLDLRPMNAVVVRVGWLYGVGMRCQPMIAMEEGDLRVNVTTPGAYIPMKQLGTPTFVGHAVTAMGDTIHAAALRSYRNGLFSRVVHVGPTDDPISWYDLLVKDFNVRPFDKKGKWDQGRPAYYPQSGGLVPTPGWRTPGYREGLDAFIEEYRESKRTQRGTGS